MKSIVEKARKIVTQLYERNMVSWNDLDREVVFAIQALNAEVQRMEALAQPEQEPVAWRYRMSVEDGYWVWNYATYIERQKDDRCEPLYTSPPQRTWVGLTDEELQPIADEYRILFGSWVKDFAQAIETKLRSKNNG